MSNEISEIAQALSNAQSELESIKKDNAGYGYKYSDLTSVIATAKPVLAKHGLAVTQLVGVMQEKQVGLTTILTHKSGQFFKSSASLPLIEMKGCNLAQSAGASLSYLRRYAYQAILGMSSEDNDASSEGFRKAESKSTAFVASTATANTEPAAIVPEVRTKFVRQRKTEVTDEGI